MSEGPHQPTECSRTVWVLTMPAQIYTPQSPSTSSGIPSESIRTRTPKPGAEAERFTIASMVNRSRTTLDQEKK